MADVTEIVDSYIAAWNEHDPARRRALVARTFSEDASYLDPLMSGEGIEEIDAMITAAQQQFPGHRFALAAGPDAHHDRVRFSWSLAANGAEPVARGLDFAELAEDGRLRSVTGFLEAQ
jgi:SnoaL-like domain